MSINQYANNRLDQEYAMNISREINRYETDTGETINKIAFCADDDPMSYEENIRYFSMYGRAALVGWADTPIVNYYSHRNLQEVGMAEDVYGQHFRGRNWDLFAPGEQMVFIGDTVYIAVY
jgi:hypothetical protein